MKFSGNEDLFSNLILGREELYGNPSKRSERVVLERVLAPASKTKKHFRFNGIPLSIDEKPIRVRRVEWKNLHFVECDFAGMTFFGCKISHCMFEDCGLDGVGLWDSFVSDCQFINCSLREAALGGVDSVPILKKPVSNHFEDCSFINCDLRESYHSCERYRSCIFGNCKLESVEFEGAVFENCVFQGKIEHVQFLSVCPSLPRMAKNTLRGCDFRAAELVDVRFANIDLDPEAIGSNPDYLFLRHGAQDLLQWKRYFVGPENHRRRWLIDEEIRYAGTPTMINRSIYQKGFSSAELDLLERISNEPP